jgi:hypothetical protein
MITKSSKIKDKENFEISKERNLLTPYKGNLIRLSVNASSETLQACRVGRCIQNAERKNTVDQEYYIWNGCPSKMKNQ